MKKNTPAYQQKLVDAFNAKHKEGEKVQVKQDDGSIAEWTVKHPASMLGGHTAVGWYNEHSSCYALDRVEGLKA